MSYGTEEGVAALARMWTDNGSFLDPDVYVIGTNPTLSTVTGWLEEISNTFDVVLSGYGFETPVEVPAAMSAIGSMVNAFVSDLVNNANSSGRFWTERAVERGISPLMAIRKDIDNWVNDNATGLEIMGVPRLSNKEGKGTMIFDTI